LQVSDKAGKTLQVYENVKLFRTGNAYGWFFDGSTKKLWIRVKNRNQAETIIVSLKNT
jgi:hypothetical protein